MNDHDTDITRVLETLASRQPEAPALHVPGRTSLRYADLGAQIRYVRERLGRWNIARGDIVVGVIPLRPEMALACATFPAASTFAPLSPALTIDGYVELLMRLQPKALLVPQGIEHPVRLAARHCGVAEIELIPNRSAPAGTFELELERRQESLACARSARPDWAYILTTSGTTGRPKIVPWAHRLSALHAQTLGDWWRLASGDVGCHLVPMHHAHGLSPALMIPLLRGSSIVCLPESDIDGFFAALEQYRLTWFTAVFTVHREILRRAPDFRDAVVRNQLRFIRVGSGQLEPDEIDRIERTFGAPLLMVFSCTEVLVIAHEPLPPRMRKPGSVGVPLCNQVAIMNTAGAFCSTGDVGEIVVRGPLVFDGYFDDPQATAAAIVDGWLHTGDLGRFDADGYLFPVGRIKDMINRGGEKISPVQIDAAIEAIPGVRAAATFAIPHPSLGEEIAAAVVTHDDAVVEASDIIDQVRARMAPNWAPRRIYFVDALPRTDSGKIRRAELQRLVGLGGADAAADSEAAMAAPTPMSPLESALAGLWSSVLAANPIGVNDDFVLLGGDSLKGARLLTGVKAAFGVEIPFAYFFAAASTVRGMARAIEAVRSADTSVNPE